MIKREMEGENNEEHSENKPVLDEKKIKEIVKQTIKEIYGGIV